MNRLVLRWATTTLLLLWTLGCNQILGIRDLSGDGGRAADATTASGASSLAEAGGAGDAGGATGVDAGDGAAPPCVADSRQCVGIQPQECSDAGEWQDAGAPCPFACTAGQCTGICNPDDQRCNGLQPQDCGDAGVWQDQGSLCSSICTKGACSGVCTPGSEQCSGLQPQDCSDAGAWVDLGAACPSICNAGSCSKCTPGAVQCNGLQPQTCDATGAWQSTGAACPFACDPSSAMCTGSCTPTSVRCDGLQPQVCSATYQWQNSGPPCVFVCNSPSGACTGVCTPGSKQCSGAAQPQTCDSDGYWQNDTTTCTGCTACASVSGTCEPASGIPCSDGNACTQNDMCQNGTCVPGTAVMCAAAGQCQQAGTCDPATGACSYANLDDGTTCNADNNACTTPDTCKSGTCVAGPAVTCPTTDTCHIQGTCASSTGVCSAPTNASSTTACTAANAATAMCNGQGTCLALTCTSGFVENQGACTTPNCAGVACGGSDGAGGTCTGPNGACPSGSGLHCSSAGECVCDTTSCAGCCASATSCLPISMQSTSACGTGGAACMGCKITNPCMQSVTCSSGVCTQSDPISCTMPNQCQTAGSCSSTTGECVYPSATNGLSCNADNNVCTNPDSCSNGTCMAGPAVSCTPEDSCHKAGTCSNPGGCSNPAVTDGTSCGTSSVCLSGVCTAEPTLTFVMNAYGPASQSVSSSPAGITCQGASCSTSALFSPGTSVTLTVAAGGTGLYHWGGSCTGSGPTCTVSMTVSQKVTLTLNAYNYAFVTSNTFSANLGGLAGGDSQCALAATNGGLPGHYVALLSTSTVNAISRLGSARGWIRTDGLPVGDDSSSLFNSGKMYYPVYMNEFAAALGGLTFSGSNDNGTVASIEAGTFSTCSDWTSNASALEFLGGSSSAAGIDWLGGAGSLCTNPASLYCFGTDLATPLTPATSSGRLGFLSTGVWDTSTGTAAADALCQSEATSASLASASSFLALLASPSVAASSRFNLTGANWIRTDGIPMASSPAAFVSGTLAAPLIVAANGTSYAATINSGDTVATGSPSTTLTSPGTAATTCNGWTVDSSNGTLEFGLAGETLGRQVAFAPRACGTFHVYCLQP